VVEEKDKETSTRDLTDVNLAVKTTIAVLTDPGFRERSGQLNVGSRVNCGWVFYPSLVPYFIRFIVPSGAYNNNQTNLVLIHRIFQFNISLKISNSLARMLVLMSDRIRGQRNMKQL
jgi:hypothetical protein